MLTAYFPCVSYNLAHWLMKGKNRHKNLRMTEEKVRDFIDTYGVVGLQECGPSEYKDMVRNSLGKDYDYYWGPGDGAKRGMRSTPILWRRDLNAVSYKSFRLTPELRIPLGAGPSLIKPKYAHVVTFKVKRPSDSEHELGPEHGGSRYINFINIHGLASLWARPRWFWARRFFRELAKVIEGLEGIVIVVGDFNCPPNSKWREPLVRAGMRSLQQIKGPMVTHPPKGVIDDIMFRTAPRRIGPQAIITRNAPSDHHALIGVFNILFRD